MASRVSISLLLSLLFCSAIAGATPIPAVAPTVIVSQGASAGTDTLHLMGPISGPAPYIGDFEAGWHGWTTSDATAGGLAEVGDFADLWSGLEDNDPCASNYTQQVAFIDAGGAQCNTWCYGPAGYTVNTTGGLAGPSGHLENHVLSPVMAWPIATYDGAVLAFDVYRHEDLSPDAPGIFWTWAVRSADTDGSAGGGAQILADQPWRDHGFVHYGAPAYVRVECDVSDLLESGRDEIQVRLGVSELGWLWGWTGNDGYPAPYFDNVAVEVVTRVGPILSARAVDLAQDNFPESDDLASSDLHVRFDMARNISPLGPLHNDPGDSLVVRITAVGTGAALVEPPLLHYALDGNPRFDAYRTLAPTGAVAGYQADPGDPALWAFDLPDTGGLFPGDVLHYYISAEQTVGGTFQDAALPADLTGFGDFSDPRNYDPMFVVRALPTLDSDSRTPGLLVWDDGSGPEQAWNIWGTALDSLHLVAGVDYDIFMTRDPGCGVGNGIGGRTAGPALAGYDDLWYAAGTHSVFTLADGSGTGGAGDDIAALRHWLDSGSRDLLLAGDNLAGSLAARGGLSADFVAEVMGVAVTSRDIRNLIGNQVAPRVLTVPDNPVLTGIDGWIAYGGCLDINTFDAVMTGPGATRLAEFTDPAGSARPYSFAAATLNQYGMGNRVISLPYDLQFVFTDPGATPVPPMAARVQLLIDIANYFEVASGWVPPEPSGLELFAIEVGAYYSDGILDITLHAPEPVDVDLRIYDLRGRQVRDFGKIHVEGSSRLVWTGRDDNDRRLPSGMYLIAGDSRHLRVSGKVVVVR